MLNYFFFPGLWGGRIEEDDGAEEQRSLNTFTYMRLVSILPYMRTPRDGH
jgi:hypothetical protein